MLLGITQKMFTWPGKFRIENCDVPSPQELDAYFPLVDRSFRDHRPIYNSQVQKARK